MTAIIVFLLILWILDEAVDMKTRRDKARADMEKARAEAQEAMHDAARTLAGSLITGKMIIKPGSAPKEDIDEFVKTIDELVFKLGRTLEIEIEE